MCNLGRGGRESTLPYLFTPQKVYRYTWSLIGVKVGEEFQLRKVTTKSIKSLSCSRKLDTKYSAVNLKSVKNAKIT
jgi:hypothetical protein